MRDDFDEDALVDDPDCCHHGVSFSEVCEGCEEENAEEESDAEASSVRADGGTG